MHIYVSSLQWNWLILMNSKFSMRFFQAVWLNLCAFSTDKVQFADNKRETPVDRSGVNLNVVNHYNGVRRETKYSANTELKCLRATQSLRTIWAAALQHDKLWQWQPANCIKPFNTFAAIHKRREKKLISFNFYWIQMKGKSKSTSIMSIRMPMLRDELTLIAYVVHWYELRG